MAGNKDAVPSGSIPWRSARTLKRLARASSFLVLIAHPLLASRITYLRLILPRMFHRMHLADLFRRMSPPEASAGWNAETVARLTDLLLRPPSPLRTTCLFRAMVRYVLLREAGQAVHFVCGYSPPSTGHAWVEEDGRPIFEEKVEGMTRTFVYPSRC